MDIKEMNKVFGFILKDRKYDEVIYTGNIELAQMAVSPSDAIMWWQYNSDHVKEHDMVIFGDPKTIMLPMFYEEDGVVEDETYTEVNEHFLNYITDLSVNKILKEKNFLIRKDILRNYDIYSDGTNIGFVKTERVLDDFGDLQKLKELVAKKEFLDGLVKFKPHRLNGTKIENPFSNYFLPTQNTTVLGSYANDLRHKYFENTKYYKVTRPGETYQPYQWKIKLYEGWITSVIAARRMGKTIYIGERAVEEVFRDRQFMDKPTRVLIIGINKPKNKTIINYILGMGGDFIKNGYFRYEASSNSIIYSQNKTQDRKNDRVLGIIDFAGARDEDVGVGDYADLIIIDECERIPEAVRDDIFPIITNEGAKCILVSTLNKRSQKTWFYKNVLRGEKEELKRSMIGQSPEDIINKMWNKHVQPYLDMNYTQEGLLMEGGTPFEQRIKTINIDEIRKEMMVERMWTALRFNGMENDLMTDKEKEIARDNLRQKGDNVFFPEWLGIFPDETKAYEYESAIQDPEQFKDKQFKYSVYGYDPAELADLAAVIKGSRDPTTNKIYITREEKLPNNFTYHGTYIKDLLDTTDESKDGKPFFAYDVGGPGQGLEPYLLSVGIRIDMKIRFTAGTNVNKTSNYHKVAKSYLVDIVQKAFEHNQIVISSELVQLIGELENYTSVHNENTGSVTYKGEGKETDDFVSAMMIVIYFIMEQMGEKHTVNQNTVDEEEIYKTGYINQEQRDKLYLQDYREGKIKKEDFFKKMPGKRSNILKRFGY